MNTTNQTDTLPPQIHDDTNGLDYVLIGDYYYPDITPQSNSNYTPSFWGRRRLAYLKEHRRVFYLELLTSGELEGHLLETEKRAEEWEQRLTSEMAKRAGITEELKATDQMKWVGLMNNVRAQVNELILSDIIYT